MTKKSQEKEVNEDAGVDAPPPINESSILLTVKLRKPGTRRRVSSSAVEVDAGRDAIAVSKELLDSPELNAVTSFDAGVRRWLYARALPSSATLREGVYRLPVVLVEEVEGWLEDQAERRQRMAENFLIVYSKRVGQAKDRLRALDKEADYAPAETVRAAFGFEWHYVALGVPDQLSGISSAMFQREQEKARVSIQAEVDEIRDALRTSFADLLERAAERLAIGPKGKPMVFRDTLVRNIEDFLQYFGARDIIDDTELAGMVGLARKVLSEVTDPGVLRSDMGLREKVRSSFEAIRKEMDEAAMVPPKHPVSLGDHE